jgi:hypothetical protein
MKKVKKGDRLLFLHELSANRDRKKMGQAPFFTEAGKGDSPLFSRKKRPVSIFFKQGVSK